MAADIVVAAAGAIVNSLHACTSECNRFGGFFRRNIRISIAYQAASAEHKQKPYLHILRRKNPVEMSKLHPQAKHTQLNFSFHRTKMKCNIVVHGPSK